MKKPIKKSHGQLPFEYRIDLTNAQKDALRHYRDKNYEQYKWSVTPHPERPNADCDIINGKLRGDIKNSQLKKDGELALCNSLIRRITNAINRSEITENFTVFKGVKDFQKLVDYKIGMIVTDKAFSSFSSSLKKAKRYAKPNKDKEKIFFVLLLEKGNHAIYIDELEDEWLVQKNSHYGVIDIKHLNDEKFGKAIVYYLRLA